MRILALLIGAACVAVAASAQGVSPQQGGPAAAPSARTGAISGVVTDSITNRPVAGAVVTIGPGTGRAGGGLNVQLTDDKGRFVFPELAAFDGYTLAVRKAGYFAGHFGKTSAGTRIALNDGQWMSNAHVMLHRVAAIGGTVSDEHGAPVAGAFIRLIREIPLGGQPHLAAGPVAQTDDRGVYRISGLDPGRYIVVAPNSQHSVPDSLTAMQRLSGVSAQEANRLQTEGRPLPLGSPLFDIGAGARLAASRYPIPTPAPDGRVLMYRPLYFPDATSLEGATRIDLKYGDDRSGVDFHLQPIAGVRVSGTVEGPPEALEGITLRLVPAGMEDLGNFGTEVASAPIGDGNRFTFAGVPPGAYVLIGKRINSEIALGSNQASLPSPPNRGASFGMSTSLGSGPSAPMDLRLSTFGTQGSRAHFVRMPVTVDASAVEGLTVTMQRGVTVVARIVKEGNLPGPAGLSIEPAQGSLFMLPAQPPGPPPADGVYTYEGLIPGSYFVRTRSMGIVKSITAQGRDITDEPLDLSNGKDVSDIVVTITDQIQAAVLSGVVRDRTGAPAPDATVILFPAERDQWTNYGITPPRVKFTTTSTTGAYRVPGLPAGNYLAIAAADIESWVWREPGFFERVAPSATRFSVGLGDKPTQDLSISPVR